MNRRNCERSMHRLIAYTEKRKKKGLTGTVESGREYEIMINEFGNSYLPWDDAKLLKQLLAWVMLKDKSMLPIQFHEDLDEAEQLLLENTLAVSMEEIADLQGQIVQRSSIQDNPAGTHLQAGLELGYTEAQLNAFWSVRDAMVAESYISRGFPVDPVIWRVSKSIEQMVLSYKLTGHDYRALLKEVAKKCKVLRLGTDQRGRKAMRHWEERFKQLASRT